MWDIECFSCYDLVSEYALRWELFSFQQCMFPVVSDKCIDGIGYLEIV